jgi:hypothetical protein
MVSFPMLLIFILANSSTSIVHFFILHFDLRSFSVFEVYLKHNELVFLGLHIFYADIDAFLMRFVILDSFGKAVKLFENIWSPSNNNILKDAARNIAIILLYQ